MRLHGLQFLVTQATQCLATQAVSNIHKGGCWGVKTHDPTLTYPTIVYWQPPNLHQRVGVQDHMTLLTLTYPQMYFWNLKYNTKTCPRRQQKDVYKSQISSCLISLISTYYVPFVIVCLKSLELTYLDKFSLINTFIKFTANIWSVTKFRAWS